MNNKVHEVLHQTHGTPDSITSMLVFVALGVIVGIMLGRLCGYLFSKVTSGPQQRAIIFLGVYGTYFVCESFHGSGILGVVAFAIILSDEKYRLSARTNTLNKLTWQVLAFWANCVLFVLTGLLSSKTFRL